MNNMKQKILMTLALLITAVGGAWAQDYYINVGFDPYYHPEETHFNCMIMSMEPGAGIKGTLELSVDGVSKGSFGVDGEMVFGSIAAIDAGDHTWSAVFKPEGGGSFNGNGDFTIDKVHTSISYNGSTSINLGVGESTELDVYVNPAEAGELSYSSSDASVASIIKKEYSYDIYIIQAKAAGTATITFSFAGNKNYDAAKEDLTITVTVEPAPIDVTLNEAKTEASFEMQTFDMDVNYELVRDMAISMTTKVGDGNDGYRIRLKKSEQNPGKFEPAETDVAGMIAMIKVHDAIENQDLMFFSPGGSVDCTVSIYAIDDNDQPVGNPVAFQDLVPGRYIAKATAATGSTYDGETANSNIFVLFLGYPVEVPAGEFATFYKDEPLYADPISSADAELYTISSINNDKAVLSSAIETAPSKTPLLVYNNSDEAKTFLLIPADAEPNLSLDVYNGFIGTLTATTIAASDEDQTNYAFNGKAFVYVKYAIPVAANKAWLNISNSNARVINIVFDETTGIANADRTKSTDDSWYTIDGRKVNAPTKKGIYILNGQKVVVK